MCFGCGCAPGRAIDFSSRPFGALALAGSYQGFASLPFQNLKMGRACGPFSSYRFIPGASPQAGMASRLWRLKCCETIRLKGRRPGLYQPGATPQEKIRIVNQGLKARSIPVLGQLLHSPLAIVWTLPGLRLPTSESGISSCPG